VSFIRSPDRVRREEDEKNDATRNLFRWRSAVNGFDSGGRPVGYDRASREEAA
jgi:hypothetical protein